MDVNIRIEKWLVSQLKIIAAKRQALGEKTSIKKLAEDAIKTFLESQKGSPKP